MSGALQLTWSKYQFPPISFPPCSQPPPPPFCFFFVNICSHLHSSKGFHNFRTDSGVLIIFYRKLWSRNKGDLSCCCPRRSWLRCQAELCPLILTSPLQVCTWNRCAFQAAAQAASQRPGWKEMEFIVLHHMQKWRTGPHHYAFYNLVCCETVTDY